MGYRYLVGPDVCLDPADRGLAYGDGLFETMAARDGRILRFNLHFDRLTLGCERLQLPLPDRSELERQIAQAAAGAHRATVKLILSRGTGPRGYAPPVKPEPVALLSVAEGAPAGLQEIRAVTLSQRLGENESLAGIKHLCRLEQVLGQLELAALNADEGIMLSSSDTVIGGTSRNLFAVLGQRLLTPDLSRAGIAGTVRRLILENAGDHGLQVSVGPVSRSDLNDADEIFMTNAIVGIQSVTEIDGQSLGRTEIATRLRDALGLVI